MRGTEETRQITSCNTYTGDDIRVGGERADRREHDSAELNRFCVVQSLWKELHGLPFSECRKKYKDCDRIESDRENTEQNHVIKECNSINPNDFYHLEESTPLCFPQNGHFLVMVSSSH